MLRSRIGASHSDRLLQYSSFPRHLCLRANKEAAFPVACRHVIQTRYLRPPDLLSEQTYRHVPEMLEQGSRVLRCADLDDCVEARPYFARNCSKNDDLMSLGVDFEKIGPFGEVGYRHQRNRKTLDRSVRILG